MPCLRPVVLVLLATACAPRDPMSVLPSAERAALPATPGLATPGRLTVAEMLSRARSGSAPAAAGTPRALEPLVLRFAAGVVQPDAAQRGAIEGFARRAAGAPRVLVVGHRAEELANPDALLGQRRAVAVARLLEPQIPEVEMRFDPGAAAGEIVLLSEESPPR